MHQRKLIEIMKDVSAELLERARVARFVQISCPPELCTCERRRKGCPGGKFLCEVEERDCPVIVRAVCPNAKKDERGIRPSMLLEAKSR
jgi:hypothetical protein